MREFGSTGRLDKKIFELLAPAGSPEILRAVVEAGADAVYVGGSRFGARAYASNFTEEELLDAIDYAHLHGCRLYLTVNTLFKNQELFGQLYDYLLPFYERGLDAVLVQDLGALAYIRSAFPGLSLHTSTQMTITGADGARLARELGAERIVAARELTLTEMKRIHEETGMELEAFVHGALCYSYSGQCLFSSMLGRRSGNRGRCAQPCRLAYSVLDEAHKECLSDSYVLSLKDLCGLEELNRLYAAGVYSLKIEGRMKQAAYAAGVVSYYRKYVDLFAAQKDRSRGPAVSEKDRQALLDLGSRCGFTDSYYSRHNGGDMVTFCKPSYETKRTGNSDGAAAAPPTQRSKIHASGRLFLCTGKPAQYEVVCGENSASVSGLQVMEAQRKPLAEREVAERMCRTGESLFVMDAVEVEMDGPVFLPNGELNRLRRDALFALSEELLKAARRDAGRAEKPEKEYTVQKRQERPRTICTAESRSVLSVLLSSKLVTTVYLDACAYAGASFLDELRADIRACRKAQKEVYLALPRVFREESAARYRSMAERLRGLGLDGVLVRSYEELQFARTELPELCAAADYSLYTYNDLAVSTFAGLGIKRNTVPLELNAGEIAHRDNRASEMVIYGRCPLMVSAQCVRKNVSRAACAEKSGRPSDGPFYLRDRRRAEFPVKNYCRDCYNVIYNSLPTLLFTKLKELREAGIQNFRLDFTVESAQQAQAVLTIYEEFVTGMRKEYPAEWTNRYTNGHYHRGVE